MHKYNPETYQPEMLKQWISIADRQAPKDRVLIPRIAKLFRPGAVLELGSGTGHIAKIIQSLGHTVVGSDYAIFFVDHMLSKGLNARRVDALDIEGSGVGRFSTVFCQSISPFITDDMNIVHRAYRSAYESLLPNGRLVLIHAMAKRNALRATIQAHRAACSKAGFIDVNIRRDQLLPTVGYRIAGTLVTPFEALLAPSLGSRFVLCATRPTYQ